MFDAIGLGIFAVSGARIGMEAGFADNIFLTTFLGTTTAIAAAACCATCCFRRCSSYRKSAYAVAAIVGALGHALLLRMGVNGGWRMRWG